MNSKFWSWVGWLAVLFSCVAGSVILTYLLQPPKRTILPFYSVPALRVIIVEVPTPQGKDLFILDTGCTRSVDIWGQKLCAAYECVDTDLPDMYLARQMLLVDKFLPEDMTIRGLLGENLLQRFSKVEIDYVRQTVSFEE